MHGHHIQDVLGVGTEVPAAEDHQPLLALVVDVEFQREPGDEELAKFNEVVRAGHAEFSRQIAG